MSTFLFLIPISMCLGLAGLAAFMWSLRNGQYEDLDGAAERVLLNEDKPIPDRAEHGCGSQVQAAGRLGRSEDNAGDGKKAEQERDHAGHHYRRTEGYREE